MQWLVVNTLFQEKKVHHNQEGGSRETQKMDPCWKVRPVACMVNMELKRPATAAELGAVRAALAACQNGSRCCATSLGRRTRAQRNRSRRKRSTFLLGARCARGPPGLPSAEVHDDGDTNGSLYEYQGLSGYGMVPKDNDIFSPKNVPFDTWDESGSESMTEYVAPAPAVYYATPAPPIEFVDALTCDRVQRTSTISDLFYAQSAVHHHGRSHLHFLPLRQRTLTPIPSDVRNGICVEPPRPSTTLVCVPNTLI